ncbi:hypothetical protein [Tengunoibacter tsumagoiensis]|uniref:Uncharacterized protein n=1 Tax=Tengunoibacter tsumagoiensis TaxID=2014871 RepID=A0A402A900_9CHLR|nr:hypothetical protein [Tengunoibacter tsumagoiensis]GCE15630.1 hypothetical protein KTT_54890 [Tengunoibacter tsumagoiensis]
MKQRALTVLAFPLLLLIISALTPLSASAASSAHFQKVHFLQHDGSTKSVVTNAKYAPLAGNLSYHGGAVEAGTTNTYAIFWEPTGNVSSTYHSLIERYFGDIGGSGLYNNNKQYKNSSGQYPSNTSFAGAWVDTSGYPESPLLDSDIQNEVSYAQSVNGWSSSVNNIFFVFTEAGQDLCFDSSYSQCASNAFCAYHSYFGSNTIYAAMPYAYSFSCNGGNGPNGDQAADETINVTSHEQIEAATDPLLNAWYDSSGSEIGDKCAWNFGNSSGANITLNGNPYRLQKEWDNAKRGCVLTGP